MALNDIEMVDAAMAGCGFPKAQGAWLRVRAKYVEAGQPATNTGSPKCAQCNEYTAVYHCEINAEPDSPFCYKYRILRAGA